LSYKPREHLQAYRPNPFYSYSQSSQETSVFAYWTLQPSHWFGDDRGSKSIDYRLPPQQGTKRPISKVATLITNDSS